MVSQPLVVALLAIALGLQVAADDADQEEGDDVGENDGDEAAGRGGADVDIGAAPAA